jgi:hypothetical protein
MTDNDVNGVAGICAGDTIFFECLVMKRQVIPARDVNVGKS